MKDLLALLRPAQWTKNAFVYAPLIFSLRFFEREAFGRAGVALLCFCLASSAAYVVNDLVDRDRDRGHPLKSGRPLAAGRVAPASAIVLGLALATTAVAGGLKLGLAFSLVVLAFLGLQFLYSTMLKNVVVVDVIALASGFVLRAAGGVVAVNAHMSSWLFVCTFLLAMFLALSKRRHEIALLTEGATQHREVLGRYDRGLLDQLIAIVSATTIIVYILYVLSPAVAVKLGTPRMYVTVPFVVFGVFRYLFLVYGRQQGGSPTDVLLGDLPLQAGIAMWIATVMTLLYW
ncbi:MAG: decaprenyl-phosphate phosphoribosyltransferase [Candidatus Binatia bacterium]